MNERAPRPERLVALFVTVFWAALVFAVYGLLAVILDRDPIDAPVGPYFGLIVAAVAGLVLWTILSASLGSRTPWPGAIGAAAAVYLVLALGGVIVDFSLLVTQVTSPFVIAAALLAGLTVLGTWVVIRRTRRPRM
jgi:hypothetical protein